MPRCVRVKTTAQARESMKEDEGTPTNQHLDPDGS